MLTPRDSDYICNWFGGQAVSLAIKYAHSKQFADAGYVPFVYDGVEYGETREYGNFSFTRIYEAGHEVPYYQPQAALALFKRTIQLLDIPTGQKKITADYGTSGQPNATHTESYGGLFTGTGSAYAAYSSSLVASYASLDNTPPASVTPA